MKACLNTITTKGRPLSGDIRFCSEVGFQGVEIDFKKLDEFLSASSVEDLSALLEENNVRCAGLMAVPFRPFSDSSDALEQIDRYAPIGQALGASFILAFIAEQVPVDMPASEAVKVAGACARQYAEAAQGLKLALEPIGGHSFMGRPEQALAIVREANHPNVSIMVDTFHYYKSGITAAEIASIPVELLAVVHINDAEDRPREQLADSQRLYPGLGVIPLVDYLNALEAIGYEGFASVELFREEYWQDAHQNVVRQAKVHLDRVIAQVT